MTRAQSTVIWLGLVLIAFNLIIHIADVKGILFGGTSSNSDSGASGNAATKPTPAPNASPTPANVQVQAT